MCGSTDAFAVRCTLFFAAVFQSFTYDMFSYKPPSKRRPQGFPGSNYQRSIGDVRYVTVRRRWWALCLSQEHVCQVPGKLRRDHLRWCMSEVSACPVWMTASIGDMNGQEKLFACCQKLVACICSPGVVSRPKFGTMTLSSGELFPCLP